MNRRKRRKVNATGRNAEADQYANISYGFWRSEAWRCLSPAAAKVWPELRQRFNGGNNGHITLSLDEAARVLHLSKSTVRRALSELEAKGFIAMTRKGQWYGRIATTWRLTDRPTNGAPATNDWKRWRRTSKTEIGTEVNPLEAATVP